MAGFIRNNNAPGCQQHFNIPEAATNTMVKPNGMADDFCWVSESFISYH
jgi:hypothetical protein